MSHTYAWVSEFWTFLADSGADQYHTADSLVLTILEASSRTVDDFCRRTGPDHEPSGFGPRLGVNWYDPASSYGIELDDDLITSTLVATYVTQAGPSILLSENTHFNLRPYSRIPKRRLEIIENSALLLQVGRKLLSVTGTWGYQDVRKTLVATVGTGGWTAGAASLAVSDATELSPGMTLWTGTQAVYVSEVDGDQTIVATRAAHGTTAATANVGAALAVSVYPSAVRTATLLLSQRRWKARDAGLTGDTYGSGGLPSVSERAAETAILRAILWGYAFAGSS